MKITYLLIIFDNSISSRRFQSGIFFQSLYTASIILFIDTGPRYAREGCIIYERLLGIGILISNIIVNVSTQKLIGFY